MGYHKLNIETWHSIEEYQTLYGQDPNLWDFDPIDFLNGAIELDLQMRYWLIDGRLYEAPVQNGQ